MSSPITMEESDEPVANKEETKEAESSPSSPEPKLRTVRNLEILEYLIGTISGTDKLAKVAKYTLDVIRAIVTSRPNSSLTKLINLIPHFRYKSSYASSMLSTYRYILRFGYTPIVLSKLFERFKASVQDPSGMSKLWLNEDALNNVLDLYYGIFDELDTLYRLSIWKNPKFYSKVVKQQCWAWEILILLGLKNASTKLNSIESDITQLEVHHRIKNHAMQLSASLHDQGPRPDSFVRQQLLQDLSKSSDAAWKEHEMQKQYQELRTQKFLASLDIIRLSFDCAANLSDLLNIHVPSCTYSVLSLGSGIAGLIKIWMNAERKLSEQ